MNEYPVAYVGDMSLPGGTVDIGSLEGRRGTYGFLPDVKVKPGVYQCYCSMSEDGKHIGAMMLVHEEYESEKLEATETVGEISVAFSGVVGFFRTPKTEYTMKQLEQYITDLHKRNGGTEAWHELNTRQFMCPSAQSLASFIRIYAHKDKSGSIDALQMEFRRKTERIAELTMEA